MKRILSLISPNEKARLKLLEEERIACEERKRQKEIKNQLLVKQRLADFRNEQTAIARRNEIKNNGTAFAIVAYQYSARIEYNKINPRYN